ncbi:UDP-N-acetyl-D-mannosamine dehydrogenase [Alphaproteobacteria bacterium]|nr:UDP-N-acetyl-D-mannosamine dehydrogenase [Alphaproteobacteria bacterium]
MSFEKISVLGLGYIGLPTAAMFALGGVEVVGVDVNQEVIDTINRGQVHIVEPDLEEIIKRVVASGHLRATKVIEPSDAFLLAVPTPFKTMQDSLPQPDLSFVKAAARSIAVVLKRGDLVILESTCPVGTTNEILALLKKQRPDLSFPDENSDRSDINIAYCPERVLPGHIVKELVSNDRIIGGVSEVCAERAVDLYSLFVAGQCIVTNAKTAEMAKLTENACRDSQIAFANELSILCDNLGIDVWELITLANRHPRINILNPGPGVGGHCIAVDPWFIISALPQQSKLMHTARNVNIEKTNWVISQIKSHALDLAAEKHKLIDDLKVAYLGLAFKADIDDLRESPSVKIVLELSKTLKNYCCVEPNIAESEFFDLVSLDTAIAQSDLLVVLVGHREFIFQKQQILNAVGDALDFCGALRP